MREYQALSSPAEAYYKRLHTPSTSATPSASESALLTQIRSIISASSPSSVPRTTSSKSPLSPTSRESLTWFDRTVLHYDGVTLLRQWSFAHERDDGVVRHVCWAWFPVPAPVSTEQESVPAPGSSGKGRQKETEQTFGAFHHALLNAHQREHSGATSIAGQQAWKNLAFQRGICIFLRDICRIFFPSGDEYTVNLPFLVNSAWSLYPSGLVVQREVDSSEFLDPDRLPTLYSLSHPFDELRPIPVAPTVMGHIFYGRYLYSEDCWRVSAAPPPALRGNYEDTAALNPDDVIVWMADRTAVPDPIAISFNAPKRHLLLWMMLSIPNGDVRFGENAAATEPHEQHRRQTLDRRKSKKGLGGPLGAGDRDRRASAIRPSTAAENRNAMRVFSTSKAPVDAQTVQAAAAATVSSQNADRRYSQLRQAQYPFAALPRENLPSAAQTVPLGDEKMQSEYLLKQILVVDDVHLVE
ncbi:hypothetical protein CALCODRAFT_376014 [Calocera cornea HHB12733]|uniref:Anaphase-promoting complex subunit 1 N-terminal domain-containing protein n=1 Tax=Calocera cornea HHB12733 TaxID=1353952 RepID=A0A165EFF7_9BASI|nr:hypothetical protein CALCODRAFT_376014 [Calocera cornea HHB12733]